MSDDLIRQKARERHFLEQLLDSRKLENYKIPVPIQAELRKYQEVCVYMAFYLFFYVCLCVNLNFVGVRILPTIGRANISPFHNLSVNSP